MKLVSNTVPNPPHAAARPAFRWSRPKLIPRRTLPTLAPAHPDGGLGGMLRRLFGFLGRAA